jgi:MFS transporter, putative metabolite:H+ symporter
MATSRAHDRLTPYQKRLLGFLCVATFFEGYDFFALTQVLPHLRSEFTLSHGQASALLGFVNLGTVLAYVLVGKADRFGRRQILTITILGYALFSALSGLAPNVFVFGLCQLLARIFLIGEWALSMVVAAEEFPAKRRGFALGAIGAMAGLGSVLCVVVVPPLTAHYGWRSVFLVGVIPLLLVAYARRGLRETARFEALVLESSEVLRINGASLKALLGGPHGKRVLRMGAIWFLTYIATQNAISVWKDYAMTELDMPEKSAGMSMTVAALVAMPAAFFAGPLLDRIGRRPGASIILLMTSIGVWGSYSFRPGWPLTISLTLAVIGVSAVLTALNTFTTELFPTSVRSSAFAMANNLLGRTGYWLSPFVIGHFAETHGWAGPLRIAAFFPVLAMGLIWLWLPETRGRELEDITTDQGHAAESATS